MKKGLLFRLAGVITVSLVSTWVCAQRAEKLTKFETFGWLVGAGRSCAHYENYKIQFFAADFSKSFSSPSKRDFMAFYFEPQINITKTWNRTNMEFGTNAGVRNYVRIKERFYFYQMIGSGPHFISAKLKSQASGFIFSDNLFLGAMTRLKSNSLLNVQFGIRHISNASLKKPNAGMNTFNLRVGISRQRKIN